MTVGIDARSLRSGPPGVATYVRNLLTRIPSLAPVTSEFPPHNLVWNQWWGVAGPMFRKWRLFHAPAYTGPLWCPVPVVLTVHDVSYLAGPGVYAGKRDPFRLAYYRTSIRRASRIIVPSSFSAQEVVRYFPGSGSRIRVIPMGVSEEFHPDASAERDVRTALRIDGPYLLHVGDIHPRRNLPLATRVAADCGLDLVAVGRVLEGPVPDSPCRTFQGLSMAQLRGLYTGAEALVYASIYEGFGLPLLEAMACGAPVVAARRASIPEVCGDAGILVEPEFDSIREGVVTARAHRRTWAERGKKRAREFCWSRTAEATAQVYRESR